MYMLNQNKTPGGKKSRASSLERESTASPRTKDPKEREKERTPKQKP